MICASTGRYRCRCRVVGWRECDDCRTLVVTLVRAPCVLPPPVWWVVVGWGGECRDVRGCCEVARGSRPYGDWRRDPNAPAVLTAKAHAILPPPAIVFIKETEAKQPWELYIIQEEEDLPYSASD